MKETAADNGEVMYIKLISGEQLVAMVETFIDEETGFEGFNMSYPFSYSLRSSDGELAQFKFEEFIPENISDMTSFQIHGANVLYMVPAKDDFKKFYHHMVKEFNKQKELADQARQMLADTVSDLAGGRSSIRELDSSDESSYEEPKSDSKIVFFKRRTPKDKLH